MVKNIMKIKYRPEIDGLRALSVLAVVLYHANFVNNGNFLFQGGFLGVDVFFVISGYLITSLILKEINETSEFNYINFYLRRARRILPMLIFITLFFIPFAWSNLTPIRLYDFSNSILSSTFFSSNFFFISNSHEYGDVSSILKPFLHTWSLSVEEQFYIIYPVFILFCFKFLKNKLFSLLLIISICSLILAQWGSVNFSILNFYFLPTRIWELFCGAMLAKIEISRENLSRNKYSNIFSLVGIILVIYSFIFFNNDTLHPSTLTLVPVFGTMMIIWYSNKKNIITKFLSNKSLVGLGLISYSLYLWHYPLFSFAELLNLIENFTHKIIVIMVSVILSVISYFFIEKPFRNKSLISNKKLFFFLLITIFSIVIFSYFSYKEKGFPNRSQIVFKDEFKHKPWEILKDVNGNCHLRTNNFCNLNPSGNKGTVFLVGDSHMITMGKPLSDELIQNNYNFIPLTNGGCYYLPKFDYINPKTNELMFGCDQKYQEKRKKMLLSAHNPIAIIGGNLNRYLSNQDVNLNKSEFKFINNNLSLEESLKISILELLNNNVKVILIYPIPELPWDPLKKIFSSSNSRNFNEVKNYISTNNVTTSYKSYEMRSKNSFELLNNIEHKNLFKVFPHKIFCDYTKKYNCYVHNEKNIFYFDSEHLSIFGAKMLAEPILKIFSKFK